MAVIEAEFTEPTNGQSTVALLRSCEKVNGCFVNFTLTSGTSTLNNVLWRSSARAEVAPPNFNSVLRNRQAQEVVNITVALLDLDLGEVTVSNVQ